MLMMADCLIVCLPDCLLACMLACLHTHTRAMVMPGDSSEVPPPAHCLPRAM